VSASTGGRRRTRHRRRNVILPVAIAAVVAVASAAATGYYRGSWRHQSGFSAAWEALPNSHAVTVLAAERQEIIDMTAATQTLSTSSTSDQPRLVSPAKVVAAAKAKVEQEQAAQQQQAEQQAAAQQSASTSTSTSTTTNTSTDTSGELSPSEAQSEAQQLMPSYGFSVSSQWTCLLDLWNNESGWEWDAENASGAYGIPQALPASKMASAGSDYMTDATTQMKWGLSYIQSTYGSPCAAWDFEEANGYY
jgi:hypothetical protein